MEEDESFDEYYAKLKDIVNSIFTLREIILEPKFVRKVLRSLTLEIPCQDYRCWFLDSLKHNWINLGIYPSCYLVKLIKSRLTQSSNHIKYSSGNIKNTKI